MAFLKRGIGLLFRPIWWILRVIQWLAGLICLLILLAVITAIPIAQFYSLGFLLDAMGRVARSGRIRDGFPLIEHAPRLRSAVLGVWLVVLPLRLLAGAAADARIIGAGSSGDVDTHSLLVFLGFLAFIHLTIALTRGARFSYFFRPLANLRWLMGSRELNQGGDICRFVREMEIKRRTWLGCRGFFMSLLVLIPPTLIFAAARKTEGPSLIITFIGGLCLAAVLSWMPILQARFALEDRAGALLEFRDTRRLFGHAPIAWVFTVLITLGLAFPLYLTKVVIPPKDAVGLITLLYVVALYPGKLLAGWTYFRARTRETPARLSVRAVARLLLIPILGGYTFLLFFTQFIGEHGRGTLFEHHAFLLRIGF